MRLTTSFYGNPYTADLLQLNYCTESRPKILPAQALKITTPLVAFEWEALLANHPDRQLVSYLLTGITEGFRIDFRQVTNARERRAM